MRNLMLSTAVLASLALPTLAQTCDCLRDDGSTVVNLQAEARRVVPQDRMTASLSIEKTTKTPAEAQSFINTKMQAARAVYSKVAGVKVETSGYNVFKQYQPEPAPRPDGTPAWTPEQREKNAHWQATQTLTVDGADKDAVLKLVGALQQQGFAVQGMNFYLSREAADKLRDELTAEALKTIKTRAKNMADALGLKSIRYARIDTGGVFPQPMPMYARGMPMAMMAKAEAMPEPVAQGGESDVVVSVSAEVRLK